MQANIEDDTEVLSGDNKNNEVNEESENWS